MPRRVKLGPPYTDIPDEVYVVVTNPWGTNAIPRERDQGDFNRTASWVQFVLRESGLGGGRPAIIECIYSMGTRDEIIVQFAAGTNIIPLLGKHSWANFSKVFRHPNDTQRSTCVFLYNWRNNGDPTNHNWKENFPASLSLDSVPARSPYPQPTWTSPPLTLLNFVHPIPRPQLPPPLSGHVDSGNHRPSAPCRMSPLPTPRPSEQQEDPEDGELIAEEDQAPEPTNIFTPYQPPAQHPSHATFLNPEPAQKEVDTSNSRSSSPPPPKFIKKLDPYELDEEAISILRSPSVSEEETKDVKSIPSQSALPASSGYRPSAQLENEINAFLQQCAATASPAAIVKKEYEEDVAASLASNAHCLPSSSYQPSAKLEDEVNAFLQRSTTAAEPAIVKRECKEEESKSGAGIGYQPSATLEAEVNAFFLQRKATTTALSSTPITTIKREYEEDAPASLREMIRRKKIKVEG